LARNFESNGPDVKIRGTAAHIAEKYMSLARDALASGDMIAAESYFQHAEHYNRIIMAAQSQFGPQHGGQPGEGGNGGFRPRWNADGSEDDGGSDYDSTDGGGGDVRETRDGGGHDRERQGGGGQDRERHTGNREHHGGGRDQYERRGPNGSEGQGRDTNGADQADDAAQSDESASDPVG
jgi:hypothetical protein